MAIVGPNAYECPTAELTRIGNTDSIRARPGRRASASAHSAGNASSVRHNSTRPTLVPSAETIHAASMRWSGATFSAHATRCAREQQWRGDREPDRQAYRPFVEAHAECGDEKEHAAQRGETANTESAQQRRNDRRAEHRRPPHRFGALGLRFGRRRRRAADGKDEGAAHGVAVFGDDVPDDADGSGPDVTGRRDEHVRVVRIVGDGERNASSVGAHDRDVRNLGLDRLTELEPDARRRRRELTRSPPAATRRA